MGVISLVDVKRKKGESFEAFMRRFKKRIIESRVMRRVQEKRYRQKPRNRNKEHMVALRRKEISAKKEYLRKIGKLKDEDNRGRRR